MFCIQMPEIFIFLFDLPLKPVFFGPTDIISIGLAGE